VGLPKLLPAPLVLTPHPGGMQRVSEAVLDRSSLHLPAGHGDILPYLQEGSNRVESMTDR
jgi:hypothetical protein